MPKLRNCVFGQLRDRSLFKCRGGGGGLKSRGGGHMNFLVASSGGGGVAINLRFPAGGGVSGLNCSNIIITIFKKIF